MLYSKCYKQIPIVSLVLLGLVMSPGCSSGHSTHSTVQVDGNSNLASLGLSNGQLSPAFSGAVTAYQTTLYSGDGSLVLTPKAASAKATVAVNGNPLSSAGTATVALQDGANLITVVVTAEDGTATSSTLTVTRLPLTTKATVLDSINGSPAVGANLTVTDADGTVLQSGISVPDSGTLDLGLDTTQKYTLYAEASGSAQAALTAFDPAVTSTADFYCHSLGMVSFPASAPVITSLAYSADGSTWTAVADGAISDTMANIKFIKVTAVGRSGISPTAWSGFGIGINVDRLPWSYDYTAADEEAENSTAITFGDEAAYRTTDIFAVNFAGANSASHYVDVVVYDVANNRTEQRLPVTLTDVASVTSDADLSTATATLSALGLNTYGVSRNIFSLPSSDGSSSTCLGALQLSVTNAGVAQYIRGYELYRAVDAGAYTKVKTVTLPSLTLASGLTVYDSDPTLTLGKLYFYEVRAFSGNTTANGGYSPMSTPLYAKFLAPFKANLAAPAHDSVVTTLAPTFQLAISDPSLWDASTSDYFYFDLLVRDKVGNAVYSQRYRYNFVSGVFQIYSLSSGSWSTTTACTISGDHSLLSLTLPSGYLDPGTTYEWSFFGSGDGYYFTANACYFLKYFGGSTPGASTAAFGRSYGSTYEQGYGAVNGYFTFTTDPNAQ